MRHGFPKRVRLEDMDRLTPERKPAREAAGWQFVTGEEWRDSRWKTPLLKVKSIQSAE